MFGLFACGLLIPGMECTLGAEEALPEDLKDEIKALISRLSDDDFDQRDAAEQKLIAIGEPALAAVAAARHSTDPEVAVKARHLHAVIVTSLYRWERPCDPLSGLLPIKKHFGLKHLIPRPEIHVAAKRGTTYVMHDNFTSYPLTPENVGYYFLPVDTPEKAWELIRVVQTLNNTIRVSSAQIAALIANCEKFSVPASEKEAGAEWMRKDFSKDPRPLANDGSRIETTRSGFRVRYTEWSTERGCRFHEADIDTYGRISFNQNVRLYQGPEAKTIALVGFLAPANEKARDGEKRRETFKREEYRIIFATRPAPEPLDE